MHHYKEVIMAEVNYVVKGEPGKTCADCKNYKDKDGMTGDCYGHEVLAAGSCSLFEKK